MTQELLQVELTFRLAKYVLRVLQDQGRIRPVAEAFQRMLADGNIDLIVAKSLARIVRLIYLLFLEGYTPTAIAAMLTAARIPTPTGKPLWPSSIILGFLTREKHYGATPLQKEFTVDYRTKKKSVTAASCPDYGACTEYAFM